MSEPSTYTGTERRAHPPLSKETGIALGLVIALLSAALTGSGIYFGMHYSIKDLRREQTQLRKDLTAAELSVLRRGIDAAWTIEDMRRYLQLARSRPMLSSLPTVDDLLYQPQARGPWLSPRPSLRDTDARADDQ